MTESQISPQDVAQYYSSQDRVRNWITTHADHVFTSPNIPPSELDDQEALSSPPSDAESSHSEPPRLKLLYPDGRESLIPHSTHSPNHQAERNSRSRSNPHPNSSRQRSRLGTAPSSPPIAISDSRREREKLRSNSPEEIHILPSASDEIPHVPSSSHHSRSRSLPRDVFSPLRNHDPMPISPYGATPAMPMQTEMSPPVIPMLPSPGPRAGFARTQPAPAPWHPYSNGIRAGPMVPPSREHFRHNPPSIIYAPSNNSRTNYHPPAILSYRPTTGPNRIFYSHSVPPAQAQIVANAGYPSIHGSHAPREERTHHHRRSSELRHESSRHRDRSVGSAKSGKSGKSKDTTGRSSEGSGSTYYVLPTARQKVHVLRSPETLYTATTTTQSPTTPISPTGSIKKPFLQRILGGFAERFSSSGSSKGSLRRRHSTGTRPADPVSGH
ncbi:hypothetical protein J3R30DRAFT_3279198 [Lentinula aciculospora]|uniref:Uncharacterized protein n=1 Tax=Lentinula aciculospora TaxID=153920 RepID=A0A9W9APV7_9AGAR|nr:hypothetical protein J3R30DRAFT_3279198 [Lentinula aciculospora]